MEFVALCLQARGELIHIFVGDTELSGITAS
jgi:hypothetical protein